MNLSDKIKDFFDLAADTWNLHTAYPPSRLHRLAQCAQLSEGARVLDAGCGTGALIPSLLLYPIASLTELDCSPCMLEQAKAVCQDSRLKFVCCDLTQYQTDEPFDTIFLLNAYPFFHEKALLVDTLARMTHQGSCCLIALTEGRRTVNAAHQSSPKLAGISSYLGPATHEASFFSLYFDIDFLLDTKDCYLIRCIRNDEPVPNQS